MQMKYLAALAAPLILSAGASAALEAVDLSAATTAQELTVDLGAVSPGRMTPTVVYSNAGTGGALRAFASTDLTATFGDDLDLVQGGELSEFRFSVFNSSTSAGALNSFTGNINFFEPDTGTFIGGFTSSFNFNTPLAPNSFSRLTVTGLDALDIVLPEDVLVTQSLTNIVGAANNLGVVSSNPIAVGSAVDQLYIDASTVNGGTAGFYDITSMGVASPFYTIYEVTVIPVPEPTTAGLAGLAGLAFLRRRRA